MNRSRIPASAGRDASAARDRRAADACGVALADRQRNPGRLSAERRAPPAVPRPEGARAKLEASSARSSARRRERGQAQAEIDAIGEDRRKLNQQLIETAARVARRRTRIARAKAALAPLDDNERTVRESLDERRGVIAEVLAALQRIGRRPPPALMVRPEDALQSVRTAMMLGAVLPEMRVEAEALAADLAELVRVRKEIAEEREAARARLAQAEERPPALTLLIEERQKRQAETERALEAERQRATDLARRPTISRTDRQARAGPRSAPQRARRSAPAAARTRTAEASPDLAALKDPGRLAPAIAFASAKGCCRYRSMARDREFGRPTASAAPKRACPSPRAGGRVTAPCDGWVVYAGPSALRPTLDPQCRRRVSCLARRDGTDIC